MPRFPLALAAALVLALPAAAVIKVLTPLKQVLDAEQLIFTAEVSTVAADKPAVTFKFGEDLKGKCPLAEFPVNLTGDSYAKKDDHTKAMLDRLAPGRQLVFFASKTAKGYSAFGYLEGTWFQMQGTTDADGKTVRWAFLHCEPYFRRTFKGTTAELKAVVEKYIAGKGDPPAPDEKEPAGYGPKPEKKGDAGRPAGLFAVLPSFVLVGPLALLAALFPAAFARLAVGMKKWRAFLTTASAVSTLALVYFYLREYLPDARWLAPPVVAFYLLGGTAVGLLWAARRYRRAAATDPSVTAPPTRNELLALLGLTVLVGLLVAGTGWYLGRMSAVLDAPWREFTGIATGLAAALVYSLYRAATPQLDGFPPPATRLSLSGESVGLAAMIAFGVATLGGPSTPAAFTEAAEVGEAGGPAGPKLVDVKLLFETADVHEVMSAVTITDNRLLFGAMKQSGFRSSGAVYCLDRETGKPVWSFDDGGELKPVYSTPAADAGRVFVGEGLHTDSDRRLFALDLATGKPLWQVPTASHTEGSPRVAGDRVVFSAGDDGLFCVGASDGKERWHFDGARQKLHVDTPPAVGGGRVYFGSGYNTLALLAVDVNTGQELWRRPVGLRSFGPPLARGDRVYFGLGTGNLTDDLSTEPEQGVPAEKEPAGAVMALDAKTGEVAWKYDLPKSVHTQLAADARAVYACCKDGWVYALHRTDGKLKWKRKVGNSFQCGPAAATYAGGAATAAVYAVSEEGRAVCLDPADGAVVWSRVLGEGTGRVAHVVSGPVVVNADPAGVRRHVYVGAMLTNKNNGAKAAAVFRIEDAGEE